MPRKKTVEKRNRQNEAQRSINRAQRAEMRSSIRRLRALVEKGDAQAAAEALPSTLGLIDRTAQGGMIHRNTAARYKSRLTRLVRGGTAG